MASSSVDGTKGELKQQGAIETAQNAAQDPQSNLTAEDAEKVLLDETKKAGMPAYQFNPDASPEEKAAEAQAVSICLLSAAIRWLRWRWRWRAWVTRLTVIVCPSGFSPSEEAKRVGSHHR